VESQDLGDGLMVLLGDALYYNAALALQQLAAQGALQQALGALSTSIFANRKSGGWAGGLAALRCKGVGIVARVISVGGGIPTYSP
jgi:hypothetical protein